MKLKNHICFIMIMSAFYYQPETGLSDTLIQITQWQRETFEIRREGTPLYKFVNQICTTLFFKVYQ